MIAFNDLVYGFTFWLQEHTSLLKDLTDAYHLDQKIHFPPDYLHQLSALEARVGIRQLIKYPQIKSRRREIASYYFENLNVPSNWALPPQVEGATYSHFVIRVPDRDKVIAFAAQHNIQLGQLIEYSMPDLKEYEKFSGDLKFSNSAISSKSLINLPIHPSLNEIMLEKLIKIIISKND